MNRAAQVRLSLDGGTVEVTGEIEGDRERPGWTLTGEGIAPVDSFEPGDAVATIVDGPGSGGVADVTIEATGDGLSTPEVVITGREGFHAPP